jgi:hypothetical protein
MVCTEDMHAPIIGRARTSGWVNNLRRQADGQVIAQIENAAK